MIKTQENSSREIIDIVKYINNHLSEELSLDIICDRFFISKSHINRKFKKVIGSTVWEYINIKRLLLAKELLHNGISPTNVYLKCGFKDYCTFFRAYKAKFGVSPKSSMHKIRNSTWNLSRHFRAYRLASLVAAAKQQSTGLLFLTPCSSPLYIYKLKEPFLAEWFL